MSSLYFDYNATAPLCESAKIALTNNLGICGNPASIHTHGRAARQRFEEARQTLAHLIKAGRFDDIIFNSSGTEGNNTVLHTFAALCDSAKDSESDQNVLIVTSGIEHPCILNSLKELQDHKTLTKEILPVTKNGQIDCDVLVSVLDEYKTRHPLATILISCMWVNNETGVVQPLSRVIEIAKSFGAYVHSDIVQGLGRLPFSLDLYPLDYATLSAHKIGGLTGFGALYRKAKTPYTPLIYGGGQEKNHRSGTSNMMGAVAFHNALLDCDPTKWDRIKTLRDSLEQDILSFCPEAKIWGHESPRVANTSCIMMPGIEGLTQVMSFDLDHISVSAGSACSSGKVAPSHVLKAMGCSDEEALNSIRVSLPPNATKDDVDRFVAVWKKIYTRCQSKMTQTKTTLAETTLAKTVNTKSETKTKTDRNATIHNDFK